MKGKGKGNTSKRVFTRKQEDLLLKQQLLLGPEAYVKERGTDEKLDELSLKIKLIRGNDFSLEKFVASVMARYESKFPKEWFYKLADLYEVGRELMDVYVKPDFVRRFIVQFVYARFPYMLLRTLRSKNKKLGGKVKLFQHLTKDASDKLDVIIDQVYRVMGESNSPLDFKMRYSNKYHVYFQLDVFEQ